MAEPKKNNSKPAPVPDIAGFIHQMRELFAVTERLALQAEECGSRALGSPPKALVDTNIDASGPILVDSTLKAELSELVNTATVLNQRFVEALDRLDTFL